MGFQRVYRILDRDVTFATYGDRFRIAAEGLFGGGPGAKAEILRPARRPEDSRSGPSSSSRSAAATGSSSAPVAGVATVHPASATQASPSATGWTASQATRTRTRAEPVLRPEAARPGHSRPAGARTVRADPGSGLGATEVRPRQLGAAALPDAAQVPAAGSDRHRRPGTAACPRCPGRGRSGGRCARPATPHRSGPSAPRARPAPVSALRRLALPPFVEGDELRHVFRIHAPRWGRSCRWR